MNPHPSTSKHTDSKQKKPHISSSSTVTSSQDIATINDSPPLENSPPPKRQCKNERLDAELPRMVRQLKEEINFNIQSDNHNQIEPKLELPDYLSDDDIREDGTSRFYPATDVTELPGKFYFIIITL